MSERTVGDIHVSDGIRWQVYEIRPDGTICSRAIGKQPNMNTLDYTKGCAYREHGAHEHHHDCHDYVVAGTRYCRKHQYVQKYHVEP